MCVHRLIIQLFFSVSSTAAGNSFDDNRQSGFPKYAKKYPQRFRNSILNDVAVSKSQIVPKLSS